MRTLVLALSAVVGLSGISSGPLAAQGCPRFAERVRLSSPTSQASAFWGVYLDLDGDTFVASSVNGVPVGGSSVPGYVTIWRRTGTQLDLWQEVQVLTTPPNAPGSTFGASVSLRGDLLVVGAPFEDEVTQDSGVAYVFRRTPSGTGSFQLARRIAAPVPQKFASFGTTVARSGPFVFVAAPYEDRNGSPDTGVVYVFEENRGGPGKFGFLQEFVPTNPVGTTSFIAGSALAADGEWLLVGVPYGGLATQGTAELLRFDVPSGRYQPWTTLVASDGSSFDGFGGALSLRGDVALVGAPLDNSAALQSGAAYVFERSFGGADAWGQAPRLAPSGITGGQQFGAAVTIEGSLAIVGAPLASVGVTTGTAHVFERDPGSGMWTERAVLVPAGARAGDKVGTSLALDGLAALVSSPNRKGPTGGTGQGAVHVFDLSAPAPPTATAIIRNDSGMVNPSSLEFEPPVLGTTVTATVDLASTGHRIAILFSFDSAVEIPLSGGQVLLTADLMGHGKLYQSPPLLGDLAMIDIAIPGDPILCGFAFSLQAAHLQGDGPFALSNAVDCVIGN
jgi:hypothetical protein